MGRFLALAPIALLSMGLLASPAGAVQTSCTALGGTPAQTCSTTNTLSTSQSSAYPGQSVTVASFGTAQTITSGVGGWTIGTCSGGLSPVQINWGDGSSSAASSQSTLGDGTIPVGGSHSYSQLGNYTVTATSSAPSCLIGQLSTSASQITVGMVVIANNTNLNRNANTETVHVVSCGSLAMTPKSVTAEVGAAYGGSVASFVEEQTHASPCPSNGGPFTARINWGDGSSSDGTLVANGGGYSVNGNHTYSAVGNYTVSVSGAGADGTSGSTTSKVTVGCTNNSFTLGTPVVSPTGTASVLAKLPCAGAIALADASVTSKAAVTKKRKKKKKTVEALIKPVTGSVSRGDKTLQLAPTPVGAKLLKKKHKLAAKVNVTYTPSGGSAKSQTLSVTLKTKKPRKKH